MTLTATARYDAPVPGTLLADVSGYMDLYAMPAEKTDCSVCLRLPTGCSTFRMEECGFSFLVEADDVTSRQNLCEGAINMIAQFLPEAAEALGWDGIEASTDLPPGMHFATFAGVERIGASYLRVTMDCAETAEMMEGGLHFSLLLPPDGRSRTDEVSWPQVDDRGRTRWPRGEEKLHRAVFTFIERDPVTGRFSFDIFAHEGSPSTRWVEAARPGDRVAVAGPGGGAVPETAHMLIAGDETALPAIRHILSALPDCTGEIILETGHVDDRLIDAVPEGMTLRWLDRSKGETLGATLAAKTFDRPTFVWVAGEAGMIRTLRPHFAGQTHFDRMQSYLAAYWTK